MTEERVTAEGSKRRSGASRLAVVAAFFLGLAPALTVELPVLLDPWQIHDDARQIIYQARLAAHGRPFAEDPNAVHSEIYIPAALARLYRLLDPWVDPLTVTKLLPFFLSPCLSLLVFLTARKGVGQIAGLWAAGAFSLQSWSRWPPQWGAGDAGELFPILQAAMLLCLVEGWDLLAGGLVVLSAHLYPPAYLLLGSLWSLTIAGRWVRPRLSRGPGPARDGPDRRRARAALLCAALSIGAGAVLLGAKTISNEREGQGRLFTLAEARKMPEFREGGRTPLFYSNPWRQLTNDRSGMGLDPPTGVLLAAACVAMALAGRRAPGLLQTPVLATVGAGILLWFAAWKVVFLYQGARFVIVSLPLAAAVILGRCLWVSLARIGRASMRRVAAAVLAFSAIGFYVPRLFASHMTVEPPSLYRFLRGLPESSLIAGPPLLLDNVPPFAEQRILVSDEMVAPMFQERYARARGLMLDMLEVYYARDAERVNVFCTRHGVTHWVADERTFSRIGEKMYSYPPFDSVIDEARRRGPPYALEEAAAAHPLFDSKGYAVVVCPLPVPRAGE